MWSYNHTPEPDEIFHYGIRGMKWKKRKARTQLDILKSKATNYAKNKKSALKNRAQLEGAAAKHLPAYYTAKAKNAVDTARWKSANKSFFKNLDKAIDSRNSNATRKKAAGKLGKNFKKVYKTSKAMDSSSGKMVKEYYSAVGDARKVYQRQKKKRAKKYNSARMK